MTKKLKLQFPFSRDVMEVTDHRGQLDKKVIVDWKGWKDWMADQVSFSHTSEVKKATEISNRLSQLKFNASCVLWTFVIC